jgi:toxin ParE1/3/4
MTIGEAALMLCDQPEMGLRRPELGHRIRSKPVEHHVLYYRVTHSEIVITRIRHSSADPDRY